MLEHGEKAAHAFTAMIRETKATGDKPAKRRSFAVGTVGGKGVLLIGKRKPTAAGIELTKMSMKQGRVTMLATGEVEWKDNEVLLKSMKTASESAVRKAVLEYYATYKATPPSKAIKLLQPSEWEAVEFDDADADVEEEGAVTSTPTAAESTAPDHSQARRRVETAVRDGLADLTGVATNLMKQAGYPVEQSPLDFSRFEKLLGRHVMAFDTRVQGEGDGVADTLVAAVATDVARLKLAMSKPSQLETLLGMGTEEKVDSKSWEGALSAAQANLAKLKAAISADLANEDPATRALVVPRLGQLDAALDEVKDGLSAALGRIAGTDKAKMEAAVKEAAGLTKKYQAFLASDTIRLLDDNPFEVPMNLAATLGASLKQIEGQLSRLEKAPK